jgi:hypothetical protein
MERRAFLAASTAAALAQSEPLAAASGTAGQSAAGGSPVLLELRRYRLQSGPMATRFSAHAKERPCRRGHSPVALERPVRSCIPSTCSSRTRLHRW